MMQYKTRDKKRTDPRPDYIHLGVDSEGTSHCYRTTDETVHVVNADGDREYRYDLDGRSINHWMDYVEQKRGWATRHMWADLGEAVSARMEVED